MHTQGSPTIRLSSPSVPAIHPRSQHSGAVTESAGSVGADSCVEQLAHECIPSTVSSPHARLPWPLSISAVLRIMQIMLLGHLKIWLEAISQVKAASHNRCRHYTQCFNTCSSGNWLAVAASSWCRFWHVRRIVCQSVSLVSASSRMRRCCCLTARITSLPLPLPLIAPRSGIATSPQSCHA